MWGDFKKFAFKGNVLDMAVGVIIGGTFTAIVNSLVANIIMPPLSLLLSGGGLDSWKIVLREAYIDSAGAEVAEAAIDFGLFIDAVVQFFLIAISLFIIVKVIQRTLTKKKEETKPAPAEDVVLLKEIRDLLKNR